MVQIYRNFMNIVQNKLSEYWIKSQEYFENKGLDTDRPTILMHVRELRNRKDLRSASFVNYVPTIDFLIREGFQVVRIGSMEKNFTDYSRSGFFDFAGKNEIDEKLLYLFTTSKGFIGTSSGPNVLAMALGCPTLVTNLTSVSRNSFSFPNAMYLPKIINKKSGLGKLNDYFSPEVGYGEMSKGYLSRLGIELRENDKNEILNSTKYFIEHFDNMENTLKNRTIKEIDPIRKQCDALSYGQLVPAFIDKVM